MTRQHRDVRRRRSRFYTATVERKLAAVLFVDIVDSTRLVAGADPEVVRRRVTRFFEKVSECVAQHGGIVEKFAGDAVMAAFGVPHTHEDDAQRATRAALAIRDAVDGLGVEARIGIEAGEVVVEDADSTFATGEAVNLAARLQQAARPGEILVGPTAYRLAAGSLVVEDSGSLDLNPWQPCGGNTHAGTFGTHLGTPPLDSSRAAAGSRAPAGPRAREGLVRPGSGCSARGVQPAARAHGTTSSSNRARREPRGQSCGAPGVSWALPPHNLRRPTPL